MRNKSAHRSANRARSAWVMLWCLCFLSVSGLTPVNATMMMSGDASVSEVTIDADDARSDDSRPLHGSTAATVTIPHEEAAAAGSHCDNASCADSAHDVCPGFCLHCSSCSFSPASAIALTPLTQRFRLANRIQDPPSENLLPGRISPPFRPPISRL
ncbi:hypothetical protein ACUNV4_00195 [Granulosicoccus sp. 3-233]|uniref:hypothetical protein n=1 Tax=Granulosicoccus sp. 3-233 TaxID=3417969 RepID=UPI003D337967